MSRLSLFLIFVSSIILLAFFFNRGFAYYDEGFILHGAQRIVQGEIPYKDFDFIYTPGTIFLTAFVFKLFGESIIVGRYLALFVNVLTSLIIFKITKKITKNLILAWGAVLIYLSWGPTHINFPWPTLLAFSTGLLSTFFLSKNYAFLGGVMAVIAFLFKQNFGFAAVISTMVFFALKEKKGVRGEIKGFILGLVLSSFVFIIYLVFTNSLIPFFNNLHLYSIQGILFKGAFATSFPFGIKSLFYLFPGLISLTSVFVAYKRQKKNIIFPLFTLFFYIFGIRPTSDYVHLTFLMANTGIPLALILTNSTTILDALRKSSLTRMTSFWFVQNLFYFASYALVILLITLGIYTSLWRNYYRWDSPLSKQKYFISDQRARIFVDKKFSLVIPEIISFIKQNSRENDYIFVFYNASMFYFLTDRQNPTRYINFSPDTSLGEEKEKEVIKDLREKNVMALITHESPESWGNPLITKYILETFTKKKEIFEFGLWTH